MRDLEQTTRVERYFIERDEGPEGQPAITAAEQVRQAAERELGRGASVLHMGSSAIGLNLNLTDEGRREMIRGLQGSLVTLARRHGIDYTPPSE